MPEDHFATIDGLKIRYCAAGDGGETIVLLHGLGAAADVWVHNIPALAREYRVIVPDLPGFGKSDIPPPSFSPAEYTEFLAKFISTFTDSSVILVGQSLGGAVVLDYALQYPERADKFVLVDSAGLGPEVIWTLRLLSLPLLGELLTCYPTWKGVEIFFKLAVRNPAIITREFVDTFYHYYIRPGSATYFLRLLRRLVNIRSVRQEALDRIIPNLHKITKPVLIVWGDKDRVLPIKHAQHAERLLPQAHLKTMQDCGHLPFLEHADEFNRVVLEFLKQKAC